MEQVRVIRIATAMLVTAMSVLHTVESQAVQQRQADVSPGATTSTPVVNDGIPFYINPDTFDFKAGPEGSNWQETTCVPIRFGHGAPLQPRTWIDVGVIVTAPLKLRDGRELSKREAQLDSAAAARTAAGIIAGMLDTGALIPTEAQPRFVGFMGGAMLATGMGYRVKGCRPTAPRNAAEPEAAESL